jgi:hypothetical protein
VVVLLFLLLLFLFFSLLQSAFFFYFTSSSSHSPSHWFYSVLFCVKVCKMLIGNQCDLGNRRVVEHEEGVSLGKTLGIPFLETSARDRTNVETAFVTMSKTIYEALSGQKRPTTPGGMGPGLGLTPSEAGTEEGHSSGCCS